MNKETKKQIIKNWSSDVFHDIALSLYSEREFGKKLNVFQDGSVEVTGANERLHDNDCDGLITILKTPGHGNIDQDFFLEDFAHWDDEKDAYVEDVTGRVVGTFSDVIFETFENGDVSSLCDRVYEDIIEDIDYE